MTSPEYPKLQGAPQISILEEAAFLGLVYSAWLSALILLSFKHEPRLWLHHFPDEVQAAVPPRTEAENRLMKRWALPITGSMLLLPLIIALWRHGIHNFGYFDAVAYIGTMMLVFCVVDLVILDWIISVWWNPHWMQIKGAEEEMRFNSFSYQLKRNLLGLPFPIVGALLAALPFLWL